VPSIDKAKLGTVNEVLTKYRKEVYLCTTGKLTCRLARLAFFGEDVMKACTTLGARTLPTLPHAELESLKETPMKCFKVYNESNKI